MERTATCVCGQLRITVEGDPARVNMCSCRDCQRRSGSAFQLGAFFDESKVKAIEGEARRFDRKAESGRTVTLHFCPECGVSVYFKAEARPSLVGVHVGCFADPDFPGPNFAVWTQTKHRWLDLPEVDASFERQSP